MTLNITSHVKSQPIPTFSLTDSSVTQKPDTFTHPPQSDGPLAKRAPFNSEAAAAYSTFKQEVIKGGQTSLNAPKPTAEKTPGDTLSRQVRSDPSSDREGASEANDLFNALNPSPPAAHPEREGTPDVNDLFNALYPPPTPTPAAKPAPPENGVDEKMGVDALHNALLAKDKRVNAQLNPVGDSQLATVIANTMSGLKDSDLENPSPMVDIPKNSTFGKWLDETKNAFTNKLLIDWAAERNIDPSSLSYDTGKKVLYGKTMDNEAVSFTEEDLPNRFSLHYDMLTPVEDVAHKMDPAGSGVLLSAGQTDKAPLDRVLNFYGLNIDNKDISSVHQAAKDLSDNDSFPEVAGLPDRSAEELTNQKEAILNMNSRYEILKEAGDTQDSYMSIEVSASGSATQKIS